MLGLGSQSEMQKNRAVTDLLKLLKTDRLNSLASKAVALGVVHPLVAALESRSSVQLKVKASVALEMLCSGNLDIMAQSKFSTAATIGHLVDFLSSQRPDGEVQKEAALEALRNLSVHADCCVHIAASGAIPTLVELLRVEILALQKSAAQTLRGLSAHAGIPIKIAGAGAVPILVRLLGSQSVVWTEAVETLRNLSVHPHIGFEIAASGGVAALSTIRFNMLKSENYFSSDALLLPLVTACLEALPTSVSKCLQIFSNYIWQPDEFNINVFRINSKCEELFYPANGSMIKFIV